MERATDTPSKLVIIVLAIAAGAIVANLYYSQPLLAVMGGEFTQYAKLVGLVPTLTQVGYAIGLLLLVPLGDSHERRGLIVKMTLLVALALFAVAYSPTFWWLLGSSFLLGVLTIVPQLVVPFSASLVGPNSRGRLVGQVMSGLLVGIILSRTLSGYAGAYIGWHTIYLLAAAAMLVLAAVLYITLPHQLPPSPVPYGELLASLRNLAWNEPVLRRHSLIGALGFGAFSAFWTSLVFHLGHLSSAYGSQTVGTFGLLGVSGALIAPISGRFSDRYGAKLINGTALALVVIAFITMWVGRTSLAAIALGTILLDAGAQGSHISNQTRIYALHPGLRNRLNAVYMFCFFIGGAIGSGAGFFLWQKWGWAGVCLLGGGFGLAALGALFLMHRKEELAAEA